MTRKQHATFETPEIQVDPASPFWEYQAAETLDPLEQLITCEEEDEEQHLPPGTSLSQYLVAMKHAS